MESQRLAKSQTFAGFTESQIRGKRKRISHLFGQTSKGQPCPILAWIRVGEEEGGMCRGYRKTMDRGGWSLMAPRESTDVRRDERGWK